MNVIAVKDFVTGKIIVSFPVESVTRETLVKNGWEQVSRFKMWIRRYDDCVVYFEDLMGWYDEL